MGFLHGDLDELCDDVSEQEIRLSKVEVYPKYGKPISIKIPCAVELIANIKERKQSGAINDSTAM